MTTLNALAELVLAYETPDGRKLARYGTQHYRIPILPPNTPVAFQLFPYYGAYCNIYFWNRWSPTIVPDTVFFETTHKGIIFHSAFLGSIGLNEGHNLWLEVTNKDFILTRVTNLSPVNQYFEAFDLFLVVSSEDDLKEIRKLVISYARTQADELMRAGILGIEAILQNLPGGDLGPLVPRPPIGGA